MLAKLDNLGPFQLFFTLSCADMRWDENFAAILLERGYEMRYQRMDQETESLHELIRGNVLTAARYYQ